MEKWRSGMGPASMFKNMEGSIVTTRSLAEYESDLGFNGESLRNSSVLNFGSGSSHIGAELEKEGIPCLVVDLDINYDPYFGGRDRSKILPTALAGIFDGLSRLKYLNPDARARLTDLKREIAGTYGRKMVQNDGRSLPFPDNTFNEVFANFSTYQIPTEDKLKVYPELLRVGKTIRIHPVFNDEYDYLLHLAKEMGMRVVENSLPERRGSKMQRPTQQSAEVAGLGPLRIADLRGGVLLVLTKEKADVGTN